MWRFGYTILITVLLPFFIVRLWWRGKLNPAYRKRIAERFGRYKLDPGIQRIWLHAVSVGEVNVALPLVRAIQQKWPEYRVLITTMTPTGAAQVVKHFDTQVDHRYIPYDHPWLILNAIKSVSPKIILIMETEIWPNFMHYANRMGITLIFMNMRLAEKSFAGYKKIKNLIEPELKRVSAFAVQTDIDAKRIHELGACREKITVIGNIKYESTLPDDIETKSMELKKRFSDRYPIWIAASTHDKEDEKVLSAHKLIRERSPAALLLIVPRHPERFNAVYQLASQDFQVARHSSVASADHCHVYVVDSMGEMLYFYAASDVCFVGGSLVPVGGHNVLEPWRLQKPVIVGPYMHNFTRIADEALRNHAMIQVENAQQLANKVLDLTGSDQMRTRYIENANRLLSKNKGALNLSMKLIAAHLNTDNA